MHDKKNHMLSPLPPFLLSVGRPEINALPTQTGRMCRLLPGDVFPTAPWPFPPKTGFRRSDVGGHRRGTDGRNGDAERRRERAARFAGSQVRSTFLAGMTGLIGAMPLRWGVKGAVIGGEYLREEVLVIFWEGGTTKTNENGVPNPNMLQNPIHFDAPKLTLFVSK